MASVKQSRLFSGANYAFLTQYFNAISLGGFATSPVVPKGWCHGTYTLVFDHYISRSLAHELNLKSSSAHGGLSAGIKPSVL